MRTVLILSGDPLERCLATRYVTDAGYEALEAADSMEASRIASLYEGTIHVAFIGDPSMIESANQIAATRGPVSILLASSNPADQVYLSSLSMALHSAFLQKPFFPTTLVAKISDLVNRMEQGN